VTGLSGASSSGLLWEERTWPEARDRLAAGCIALLPVGATDPHGPHLPISTDVVIASEMARRAAARLAARGLDCLILPAVAYSVADWTSGFAGRISLSPGTARALLTEVLTGAHRAGARRVAVANAHLEPAHIGVLREAVSEAGRECGREPVFPDVTRRAVAARLGAAFQSGDHAGGYETSLLMAAAPGLVRESERRGLPKVEDSLVARIQAGAKSFAEAGMTHAYTGDPASATAEEGDRLFGILAEILDEAVAASLES
jgi:creatinine amidohydrolase